MDLVFVELPHFTNAVADYFEDDEAYRSLQEHLLHSPTAGSVMKGCGGLRKIRWRDPKRGKGKRSGLRVIYLYLPEFETLALFDVYDRDESEDLDPQENGFFPTQQTVSVKSFKGGGCEMKRNRPSLFERLKSGMDDLLLYARDEKELVETRLSIPEPPRAYCATDVVAVRLKLGLSQSSLASLMHVSIKTVQSWEQGLRTPSGVASRLLQMFEEPGPFLKALHRKPASRGRGSIAG